MKKNSSLPQVLDELRKLYPDAGTDLKYSNPFELAVAVILSAQCTDARVNKVTPALFKKYKSVKDFANARPEELEKYIFSTGFYKNKAKSILGLAKIIQDKYKGELPDNMEELIVLPGIGRKTANVLLANLHNKSEGICVDTHVLRLSQRFGFSKQKNAITVERDLMKITPTKDWITITNLLIAHGRQRCFARSPQCEGCPVIRFCSYSKKKSLS